MTGPIVVAGDAHLGAERADADAFESFLAEQSRRDDLAALVLLGDVWDMIRRDPFGCAWETSETIAHLKRLADGTAVYVVFGNHDTHLRHLDASRYDVAFREELVLESGDASVRFCHGESFDRLQFDALSTRLSGPGDRSDVDPTKGLKDPAVARGRELVLAQKRRLLTQKRRLRTVYETVRPGGTTDERGTADERETTREPTYPRRERRAHAFLDRIPEDKLVYGHTHSPYVHPDDAVANPGSWTTTAPVHNTYLEIDDGTIALYRHARDGPDELVDPAAVHGDGAHPDDRSAAD